MTNLKGLKVAILATDGFEQDELLRPRQALEGREPARLESYGLGQSVKVDEWLNSPNTKAEQFDALLLPGGVIKPDKLRMEPKAVEFVRSFFDSGKTVAAICHGPWSIIEAGAAGGRRIASWPSLKTDLKNAGAEWVDQQAVVDGNLVSARKPDDIPAFNKAMLEVFGQAKEHPRQVSRQHDRTKANNGHDANHHVQRIRGMLHDTAVHAREDVRRVSDPKVQALLETTAEALQGLIKAYNDCEKRAEAWR